MKVLALFALGVCAAAALHEPVRAAGNPESSWAAGPYSRMRLIAGGRDASGTYLAGVEIEPKSGFKTYWRDPGDSGVPPVFDWGASVNAGPVAVSYPAPERVADPGGFANAYHGRVVFPISVAAAMPDQPVRLVLTLDYAVCETICVPVRGEVDVTLPAETTAHSAALAAARSRVPEPVPLGRTGELTIGAASWAMREGKRGLMIAASVPDAQARPDLFLEAPEGWSFAAPVRDPSLSPVHAGAGRPAAFFAALVRSPEKAGGPVAVKLTLVAGTRAIETPATIDAPPATP